MLGISAYSIANAAGLGAASLRDATESGRTGLRPNNLDWCDLRCWVGAVDEVQRVSLPRELETWDCRNHRLAWLALQDRSFREAVDRAIARYGSHRVGLALGTSTSGMRSAEEAYAHRVKLGRWPASFDYHRTHAIEALCRFAALVMGLEGPMVTLSTACSSSAKTFMTAQRWIESGLIDAAVVGGVDSLCLTTLHGFHSLQLLSADMCRPFDATRTGISIGEAAGFALIDREPTAISFLGGGESSDAWHISAPHPEGRGAQEAMRLALAAAELQPSDIGYLNAHGTATPANDRAESTAISAVFGHRGVPVSSTKGITGHTLGAAGIVEALITIQALESQALPASANLVAQDPSMNLDLVTTLRPAAIRSAISNNFGFGGSNCSLVFGLVD